MLILSFNISFFNANAGKITKASNHDFQLNFYPQQVYLNENASFVLNGERNSKFSVSLNGKKLGDYHFPLDGTVNCKFIFKESGKLKFSQEKNSFELLLLSPKDKASLA